MPFYSASKPAPSREELLAMADASRDWEVLCTGKGQWRYMSPACERVTGYTREEFLEHPSNVRLGTCI